MKRREELLASYIINNGATVRQCAKEYGISKSTVHNDVSKKLKKTNKFLYFQVCKVLKKNMLERHIRGGYSTKMKYTMLKLKNNEIKQ